MKNFIRFVKDESGATAIEYGLIAAAMGLALVTAMPILASAVTGKFSSLAGHISSGT
jgi:pilus assembly protein Flp/PilA